MINEMGYIGAFKIAGVRILYASLYYVTCRSRSPTIPIDTSLPMKMSRLMPYHAIPICATAMLWTLSSAMLRYHVMICNAMYAVASLSFISILLHWLAACLLILRFDALHGVYPSAPLSALRLSFSPLLFGHRASSTYSLPPSILAYMSDRLVLTPSLGRYAALAIAA